MNAEEAAPANAPTDRIVVEPDSDQLRPSQIAVLTGGDLGDFSVYVRVSAHDPQDSTVRRPPRQT